MAWGSITIEANPVTAFEDYHRTLPRERFAKPKTTKRDQGGFWSAEFEYLSRSKQDALAFLNSALGREIKFFNDHGTKDWEGMINTVTLDTGTARMINTLNDMTNKIWVRYTPIGGGAVARSTVFESAVSQGRFGIKEFVLSGGEIDAAQADQLAESYLNLNFWPTPTLAQISQGGSILLQPKVTVKCIGYIQTLKWRRYNQTAVAGTQGTSTQVGDIITAVGQFVATTNILANSTLVTMEYDADREALGIIDGCADLGDLNNNIWVDGMEVDRDFYFREAAPAERLTA